MKPTLKFRETVEQVGLGDIWREEGRVEGLEEGIEKGRVESARNALLAGLSISIAANISMLPEESVAAIARELGAVRANCRREKR